MTGPLLYKSGYVPTNANESTRIAENVINERAQHYHDSLTQGPRLAQTAVTARPIIRAEDGEFLQYDGNQESSIK
jgi:hypothetical protein